MKFAFTLLLPVVLGGCAVSGSWLDHVGEAPNPPNAITEQRAAELTGEVAQLRVRAQEIRARLSRETDRNQRFNDYEDLRAIGDRLAPAERELRFAGRNV